MSAPSQTLRLGRAPGSGDGYRHARWRLHSESLQ